MRLNLSFRKRQGISSGAEELLSLEGGFFLLNDWLKIATRQITDFIPKSLLKTILHRRQKE